MVRFSVEKVRDIAERASYKEIQFNEKSRLISFRRDTTRINVYYSTGTVGTCLNHPKKGKTQLFRRIVDLDRLELIFFDPRSHTGQGYYRKNASQMRKSRRESGEEKFEYDSARRWRFVASASGLSTKESEIERIAKFCNKWDSLYWDQGEPPSIMDVKFACGSRSTLCNMVFEVANELLGRPVRGLGWENAEEDNEVKASSECCNQVAFLQAHAADVEILKRQLQSFRDEVQIDLMQWFFSRDHCGFVLFDSDLKKIETKHSDKVGYAHDDYAELMYTKKTNLCPCHGLIFDN